LLATMLRDPVFARVLVFTRTKLGADRVVRHLAGTGIEATGIHGNKSQPQRERALAGFRDGQTRVLVATDIAARGIDVDGVSPVINFDLPNETSATLVIPGVQNRRQHQRQPLSAVIRLSSAERSLRALLDR
jgi:superfamily II DNA/RNA helicase